MPHWARDGRELFYVTLPENRDQGATVLMSVPVLPGPSWSHGAPVKLFESRTLLSGGTFRTYDAAPDGKRFLVIDSPDAAAPAPRGLVVVEHWFEELKQRVPAK